MNRRRLLRGAAATLAGAAVPLAGCDAPRQAQPQSTSPSQSPSQSLSPSASSRAGAGAATRPRVPAPAATPDFALPTRAEIDAAARAWTPWTEPTAGGPKPLLVSAGSALDLSAIAAAPVSSRIGRRGLGFNLLGFRLPEPNEVPDFVAAVRRNGHAFVRFFALDPWFGNRGSLHPAGDRNACAYDPQIVDRWWRYLAALSDAGVRYAVEFQSRASAMIDGRAPWPDAPEPASRSLLLRATLNEADAVDHWKHCFEVLCNRVNPYFAKPRRIVDDQNCVYLGTCNENNLWNRGVEYFGQGAADVASVIQPHFDRWQAANGGTTHAVPRIRGLVSPNATRTYGRFLLDTHAASYGAMREHLRRAGYAGRLSAVNYVPDLFDGVLRAETLDMVDCHMYFDLDDPGTGSANRSIIGDRFHNANWLASCFVHGKPASVSEFAVGGPSPYGYEFPFAYALAAMQDWDWIAQFERMDNTLHPLDPQVWSNLYDKQVRVGHDATKDVVSAAASRIGAFLFNRGDVARADTLLGFVLRRDRALATNPPWNANWPRAMTELALLCAVRTVRESDVDASLKWIGAGPAPTRLYDPLRDHATCARTTGEWIAHLKTAGILPADNASDAAVGIFESANGQLRLNAPAHSARVVTPRSHLIVWDDDAKVDDTPFLMLDAATGRGLISIHDLSPGGAALTATTRALMIHLTEVRGSASDGKGPYEFATAGAARWEPADNRPVPLHAISGPKGQGWRAESWLPVRLRGGKAIVRLALPPGAVSVFRLDIRGNRLGTIPVQRLGDSTVRMVLDNTGAADLMQTVYYEVTVTPPGTGAAGPARDPQPPRKR